MILSMIFLAAAAGLCFAVQGPVNAALGKRTCVLQASLISFFGGTSLLAVIVLLAGKGNLGLLRTVRPWQLLGGLYGGIWVCISVASMPVLGAALSLTATMLGQLLMGAVIDQFGWFGVEAVSIVPLRAAGILTASVGIFLIYFGTSKIPAASSQQKKAGEKNTGKMTVMLLLAMVGGILSSIQSPTNASLSGIIGRWEGTFVSFVVGLISIMLFFLIAERGKFRPMKGVGIRPWMLIGGAYGVIGIFLNLYTVFALGSALQVACGMVGQLAGGIVIDTFGLLQTEKKEINRFRLLGALVIAVGVVLVAAA